MNKLILIAISFLFSTSSFALKFSNQFVEFELPNMKWTCALEGAEWVCQSNDDQKKRDAIIVLAAKLKGEQDSLDKYQEYLTKPRSFTSPNGKNVTSQPRSTRVREINAHPWVDSLHLDSEIPGFYTRYLATIKQDIGVLVTYSVNQNKYKEYTAEFDALVSSLKVFRKAGGFNTNTAQNIFNQAAPPGSFTAQNIFPDQPSAPAEKKPAKKAQEDDDLMLYVFIGGAALIGFYFMKKRRR